MKQWKDVSVIVAARELGRCLADLVNNDDLVAVFVRDRRMYGRGILMMERGKQGRTAMRLRILKDSPSERKYAVGR